MLQRFQQMITSILILMVSLFAGTGIVAQEQVTLTQAGYVLTDAPEEFASKTVMANEELPIANLHAQTLFFGTAITCDAACQSHFKPEETFMIHRWVRDYGIGVLTTQIREFSLQEWLDNGAILRSEQKITEPGTWFVEVKMKTLDGDTLCYLSPPVEQAKAQKEPPPKICKFIVRVK
jgi:hypothetical protein